MKTFARERWKGLYNTVVKPRNLRKMTARDRVLGDLAQVAIVNDIGLPRGRGQLKDKAHRMPIDPIIPEPSRSEEVLKQRDDICTRESTP